MHELANRRTYSQYIVGALGGVVRDYVHHTVQGAIQDGQQEAGRRVDSIINWSRNQGGRLIRRASDAAVEYFREEQPANKNRKNNKGEKTPISQMTDKGTNGDEVAVVPIPRRLAKSHPDYFSIKLPWYERTNMGIAGGANKDVYTLRMNSIWDPNKTFSGTHQPLGRDTWAAIYQYYHVIAADITLTFKYERSEVNNDADEVYPTLLVGYQISDDDSEIFDNGQAFVEGKHSKAVLLEPTTVIGRTDASIFTNYTRYEGGSVSMQFHYRPEEWDYHIQSLGSEERWTPIAENPAFNHYIMPSIYYGNNQANAPANTQFRVSCFAHISYTVQFREVFSLLKKSSDDTEVTV